MINVCVFVPLSQHSSRDLLYVKSLCVLSRLSQPRSRDLSYVKCLCFVPLSHPSSRDLL